MNEHRGRVMQYIVMGDAPNAASLRRIGMIATGILESRIRNEICGRCDRGSGPFVHHNDNAKPKSIIPSVMSSQTQHCTQPQKY
jgi:hypothetical protein